MAEEFKSFFKRVTGNEGDRCHYATRLDTYGCGCSHDCSYCYAKSLLDFRKLWNPSRPHSANFDAIARTIKNKLHRGEIVRLGGMTDCFQYLEKTHRVTYKTIEQLNKAGVGYLIVTKSDLVASDEYISLMRRDLAHIQISITTTSDELVTTYEKAPVISKRIAAVERLYKEGFDVSVRLSPYIPQYVDYDVLNAIQCDKILVEFLRVNTWIKKWFDIDYSGYTHYHAGYHHLPLEKKIELLKPITGFSEISICEDVPDHWEYWRQYVNSNPEDCCNLKLNQNKNMAIKQETISLSLLDNNTGQIPNVPKNPRDDGEAELYKMKKSIKEDPELLEAERLLVYPFNGRYVVIGGNLRLMALKSLGHKDAPCDVIPAETSVEKIKRYILKTNGSIGKWDWDDLANEWDDLPLNDFGLSVWSMPKTEVAVPQPPQTFPAYQPQTPIQPNVGFSPAEGNPYPTEQAAPQVFAPNLNPVDGEKPVTEANVIDAQQKLQSAFSGQVQEMQEVMCPACGHKFYIKN